MSLDLYLKKRGWVVMSEHNITHNVTDMAAILGVYDCLWHPETSGISKAHDLIDPLTSALRMIADPKTKAKLDSLAVDNKGWGTTEQLQNFLLDTLKSCVENPTAKVEASR